MKIASMVVFVILLGPWDWAPVNAKNLNGLVPIVLYATVQVETIPSLQLMRQIATMSRRRTVCIAANRAISVKSIAPIKESVTIAQETVGVLMVNMVQIVHGSIQMQFTKSGIRIRLSMSMISNCLV